MITMKDYAEICNDFKFYYPNGIPKDAKRCCFECIYLDESKLKGDRDLADKIHCLKNDREAKRAMWKSAEQDSKQLKLLELLR